MSFRPPSPSAFLTLVLGLALAACAGTRPTGGDAVRDEEIRAVFVHRDDGGRRMVSAGARVRCSSGRGDEDCSPERSA